MTVDAYTVKMYMMEDYEQMQYLHSQVVISLMMQIQDAYLPTKVMAQYHQDLAFIRNKIKALEDIWNGAIDTARDYEALWSDLIIQKGAEQELMRSYLRSRIREQ